MRTVERLISAEVKDFIELTLQEQNLLRLAAEVRLHAQAPYSNYWVGAAVLSEKGMVHVGCNVERCTWTQTTHAEQSAIDSMVASLGPSKILVIAVVGGSADVVIEIPPKKTGKPIATIEEVGAPCGHCLQIIWENCFQDRGVKYLDLAANGEVVSTTIGDALPMRFGPEHLGVDYRKKR